MVLRTKRLAFEYRIGLELPVVKVAYFHHSGDLYGSSKSLLYLIIELRKKGIEPLVVLAENGLLYSVLQDNCIDVELVEVTPVLRRRVIQSLSSIFLYLLHYGKSFHKIKKIITKKHITILHSNDIVIGLLPGIIAKLLHMPHVWHIRTNVTQYKFFLKLVRWILLSLSDSVICISKSIRLQFGSRTEAKMKLVYNGLPPEIIRLKLPYDKDFRIKLGLSQNDTVVCCIGRINSWKGQIFLAQAFAAIQNEIPDTTKLLFVGDVYPGNEFYQVELDKQLGLLGIQHRTYQTRFVNDIRSVYEAIDILVVPSLIPEPFGMVVVEGMAYSCPIIAANHGGPSEIVQDHVTGLLYAPDDLQGLAQRIKQLVYDDGLRTQLGNDAREFIETAFSINETAEKVYDIYQSCLNR